MLFQTSVTDFLLWNLREDILKIVGNQKVSVPVDVHYTFWSYTGSQWDSKLFGYQHSSKYLLLFYTEETTGF